MGTLLDGKLKKTIEKELPVSLAELKLYVKTSKLSEAKKAGVAELEKERVH